jgi:uncharacterized protein (DUF1697 family)
VTTYVALLRAINVGGTGRLAMTDLRLLCAGCGFRNVVTYIQSGNVVFQSRLSEGRVKAVVEQALARKMGKPFSALLRTAAELSRVLDANPFPRAAPNRVLILFLDEAPPLDGLKAVVAPGREELALRGREIFVHFPDGQGHSKLKVPFQKVGTGRNLNTVGKLAAMAREISGGGQAA